MKPIINPWLIYFVNMLNPIRIFLIIGLIVLLCISIGLFEIWLEMECNEDDERSFYQICKKVLFGFIAMIVLFIAVPNKETAYTMVALKYVTPNNIETVGDTTKDVVDYITDQIDKIVNKKMIK